ncbi:MAG: protein kinase [Nitrospinae bacterium]|nr:protein kinase [Nitrospinota bacterium]
MGLVYKGLDPKINRPVALKIIRSSTMGQEAQSSLHLAERLLVEAQAAGRLSHPSILTIYDVGEQKLKDGSLCIYIAMEFLEGKRLDWHIKNNTYTYIYKKLNIIREIAEGMEYAHRRNVIHRDLKSSNIIIVDGDHPKIMDFGLAKIPDSSITLTLSGTIMGTPSYMSTEQIYGKPVDHKTDIYSLTVILFEIISGKKPFTGNNITSIIFNAISQPPPMLNNLNPELGGALNSFIQKGLAKKPEDRFENFTEYLESLNKIIFSSQMAETMPVAPAMESAQAGSLPVTTPRLEETPLKAFVNEMHSGLKHLPDLEESTKDLAEAAPPVKGPLEIDSDQIRRKNGDLVKLRVKFTKLLSKYTDISYSIDEKGLADCLDKSLTQMGFSLHTGISSPLESFVKQINHDINRGRLFILLYKHKESGYDMVKLFRELLKLNPEIDMGGVIPLFRGIVKEDQQQAMLRFLGDAGVRFTIFFTKQESVEHNVAEILSGLVQYSNVISGLGASKEKRVTESKKYGMEDIEIYKGLLELGDMHMRSNQHEEAAKVLSEAVQLNPDINSLVNRGDAKFKRGMYVDALNDYREANKLNQEAPAPYAKIGGCCMTLGRNETEKGDAARAQSWYEAGIKRLLESEKLIEQQEIRYADSPEKLPGNPYFPLLSAVRMVDYEMTGMDDIKRDFSKLAGRLAEKTKNIQVEDKETDIETLMGRALALAASGNKAEAERIFIGALKRNPEHVSPDFNNYAVQLRKAGEYSRAYGIYQELLKYQIPEKTVVIENMKTAGMKHALQLRNLGRFEEAKAVYKTMLSLDAGEKEWMFCELASIGLESGDQPGACKWYNEAISHNPDMLKSEKFKKYPELENMCGLMVKKPAQDN